MKKYFIILLMAVFPTLALAQQAGGHITRPTKPATTSPTKPPKKQTPPKKLSTAKPSMSRDLRVSVRIDEYGNKVYTIGSVQFKMVAVEGGSFTMGEVNKNGAYIFGKQEVALSSFCIGETEVTQALWETVMGSNPSDFKGTQRPVENVNWNDCQKFISKLNAITGEYFHLPTEAQWEFAARGGRKSRGYKYAGSNYIGDVAWYDSNSGKETHSVATKQANELGIYDMSGNVCEWCYDRNGEYNEELQYDPAGPSIGYERIRRGGCMWLNEMSCRVSYRGSDEPDHRISSTGLRLAL